MPTITTFPGVYVEEDHALSLSITSGNTAVPVFIFNPVLELVSGTSAPTFGDKLIKIESWMDYLTKFAAWMDSASSVMKFDITKSTFDDIKVDGVITVDEFNKSIEASKKGLGKISAAENDINKFAENLLVSFGYYNLQHYFENGGGACYLYISSYQIKIPVTALLLEDIYESFTPSTTFDLTDIINSKSDITLVCLCGTRSVNGKFYDAISNLFTQVKGHGAPLFCLNGSADVTSEKLSKAAPAQSAVYYPLLKTNYDLKNRPVSLDKSSLIIKLQSLSAFKDGILNSIDVLLAGFKSKNDAEKDEVDRIKGNIRHFLDTQKGIDTGKSQPVILSPVAAVAGAYCRTDSERGVWKAPANVVLGGVKGLCNEKGDEVTITDAINADLMKEGINAIRYFPNQGYTLWGARTLETGANSSWRYIPVRRLFNIAERDIKQAMAEAIFEPNTPATWEIIRSAVDVYLHSLWTQGALFGDKPAQAYFVQIGLGATMTAEDINQGRMIVKVGMAAVKPAEFIILEFSQKQI